MVRRLLDRDDAVNVVLHRGASVRPDGDVVTVDVPRESVSYLLEEVRDLLGQDGAVTVEELDVSLSETARRAERLAPGQGVDAVVWEQLEAQVEQDSTPSGTFFVLTIAATMLAGVGILVDSAILVVGAMAVGPDFAPVSGLAVGLVQRRRETVRRSVISLVGGFAAGIVAVVLGVLLLRAFGHLPAAASAAHRTQTGTISQPDVFNVIVALLAGVAGMVSLTSSKSAALVGVLVSVTTVPAAADVGVSLAGGIPGDARGAAAQLGLNVGCLLLSGVATLLVQKRVWDRRRARRTEASAARG